MEEYHNQPENCEPIQTNLEQIQCVVPGCICNRTPVKKYIKNTIEGKIVHTSEQVTPKKLYLFCPVCWNALRDIKFDFQ
jgi:hypothetical protein